MKKYVGSFILVMSTLLLMAFNWPERLNKKIAKEIKLSFEIEEYSLEPVLVEAELNAQLKSNINGENLFKLRNNEHLIGYVFVDKAPSKTAVFDYMVLFDENLIIKKAHILTYREDYGGEISSTRWLKQFKGISKETKLIYERDIIAISGATISANSMTTAINNLLQTIKSLHNLKII